LGRFWQLSSLVINPVDHCLVVHSWLLTALLDAHRPIFGQQRVYPRIVALVCAELFAILKKDTSEGSIIPSVTSQYSIPNILREF
jgi:hypothetical protein